MMDYKTLLSLKNGMEGFLLTAIYEVNPAKI